MWPTANPFLFCVHHNDHYPCGNGQLGPKASLSGRDLGNDFTLKDGFRMYHGRKVPGFPAHPHRGFETITIVEQGFVDHADSKGAAGRYGEGDVQWMTAGKGLQHSEMFPLVREGKDNHLELFQIWLNLPAVAKLTSPQFMMHWSEQIPKLSFDDDRVSLKLIAGSFAGKTALPPPEASWAARQDSHVAIYLIEMEQGGKLTLPETAKSVTRNLYFYKGATLNVGDTALTVNHSATLDHEAVELSLEPEQEKVKFLILQGVAINEPVVQHGPFVMNKPEEIMQAFEDFRKTEFGGWPWPSFEQVHGKDKGRFATYFDGKTEVP